jgi:HlyD family secretion protein
MKVCVISLFLLTLLAAAGCGNDNDDGVVEGTGTIDAVTITVSSEARGKLIAFYKEEGDLVQPGDTLALIDPEQYLLQLKQAEAATEAAQAQYDLLLKGARREDIFVAEDKLNEAEINLQQAEKDFRKMESLFEKGAVTEKQFDEAKLRFELIQSNYNSAKANYQKVKNIIRPEELKQAEANLRRMKANEEIIKKMISDCYVTAPIGGIITDKFLYSGELAAPMTALCTIADLSSVELDIYVSEKELAFVKYNQSVDVSIDAFEDKVFQGRVIYISPEAEFTPKNIQTNEERTKQVFKVTVRIDNPDMELKDGLPADAVIRL